VGQIVKAEGVSPGKAIADLTALGKVPPEAMSYLKAHGPEVKQAAADGPGQWQTWYWICCGAAVFFVLCVPLLDGRWRPKAAKKDAEDHAKRVDEEMAALGANTRDR
jgi:hypothetical protein